MNDIPLPHFEESPLTSQTLSRSQQEVQDWRKASSITVNEFGGSHQRFSDAEQAPATIPPPLLTFEECSFLPDFIHNSFKKQSFKQPTPIQSQSWSIIFEKRDMVAIAKTGSGKTLGFMVPGILHIMNQYKTAQQGKYYTNSNYMSPIALVLAPTRELVTQIEAETRKVLETGAAICSNSQENLEITVASAYGGVHKGTQLATIKQRNNYSQYNSYGSRNNYSRGGSSYQKIAANHMVPIIVACPGRLQDFLQSGNFHVGNVSYFVLDEADRMLDMGFEPQINAIVGYLRENSKDTLARQTLMFSATWPREVQSMASRFLRPNYLQLRAGDNELSANTDVRQIMQVAQPYEKNQRVIAALLNPAQTLNIGKDLDKKLNNVLIFCAKKYLVEELCGDLKRQIEDAVRGNAGAAENPMGYRRYNCYTIHGDKSQSQRDWVLDRFRQCCAGSRPDEINVLIATDVAQRGLDISNLDLVINYDFPNTLEDYVHRIGRTGRAGSKGFALSFISRSEYKIIPALCALLVKAGQDIPESLFSINPSARSYASSGNLNDSFRESYLRRGFGRGGGSRGGFGGSRGGSYGGSSGGFGGPRGGFDRSQWGQRAGGSRDDNRSFHSNDRQRSSSNDGYYKRDRDYESGRHSGSSSYGRDRSNDRHDGNQSRYF
ncbi:ATP-dependent DEAD/H RNA helicase [Perkinsela sp. CCAP 1560/4]|nr:ATP-dependent DEAD/H RNA helicase [Perkinsela sp. CCAP 1560/4]|eukprot:KNH07560.1 ATP-dependent DEAD/H RNA helicase [Perkinsela sp. CCAP 1560/4]